MAVSLPDNARRMLDGKTVVTLATLNPDGSPQASPVWAARDGDDVLLSTLVGRRKERNLRNDPRVSVVVVNPENPYEYVEIRGTASLSTENAGDLIEQLSHKYTGAPYSNDGPGDERVVVRVTPEHITGMG
ncbi:MAG TPA: PPOX class F420-dependent oxidoreductase [Mycobacteriales bacterium]|jgi:PPOX class probable F420-dependent enzyme|nr:pyridoxamine 5-phosphate oxidase [Mycobacterium sp.]